MPDQAFASPANHIFQTTFFAALAKISYLYTLKAAMGFAPVVFKLCLYPIYTQSMPVFIPHYTGIYIRNIYDISYYSHFQRAKSSWSAQKRKIADFIPSRAIFKSSHLQIFKLITYLCTPKKIGVLYYLTSGEADEAGPYKM
jgi:hypothetical protein